ncbi:hypothetical protein PACTADRAFT_51198 [Pachysolen tannophilus NRRL Y-2460]|uniref:Uncharacterized protein n=1 Tax=Pachysolen tannophilus NRRL Y-2460 TaxID=669874 RepID=A0A1E4TRP2_PACTA|nr:hypothetical protein PACTADRAFT_51198 [Pachysolen tannophilus NRRL Y-2460]
MSKAGSLEIKIPIIGESRFDMWTFIVNIVLSDVLYRPIDIQEPVLGIAWKNEKNNNSYSILTFYFARNHLDKSDKELIQLSKFIHFVRNCLPFELKEIIQEPNMLYCVSIIL